MSRSSMRRTRKGWNPRAVDVPATERVQSRSHIVEFVVVKVG